MHAARAVVHPRSTPGTTMWSAVCHAVTEACAIREQERSGPRSAEGEAVGLDASVEELDADEAVGDLTRLTDQLVRALLAHGAGAVFVHVRAVRVGCGSTVQEHPESC